MLEVRVHGRGGAGLRHSPKYWGKRLFSQVFKRRILAYTDQKGEGACSKLRKNRQGENIGKGYVTKPDIVVILDDSLDFKRMLEGTTEYTLVLVNTNNPQKLGLDKRKNFIHFDATSAALETIGKPIQTRLWLACLYNG